MQAEQADQEIAKWLNHFWTDDVDTTDGHDLRFIGSILDEHRPKTIVEIGCGSGMSAAMIALMQSKIGPAEIHSFDLADRFVPNPAKDIGYVLDIVGETPGVDVYVYPETSSAEVETALDGRTVDFCFIDANHLHPWPLMDTLSMLPLMRPGSVIVHHDLRRFTFPEYEKFATGPKIVMDQTPPSDMIWFRSRVNPELPTPLKKRKFDANIFGVRATSDYRHIGGMLSRGFYLGWDKCEEEPFTEEFGDYYSDFLRSTYSPAVAKAFDVGRSRHVTHMEPFPEAEQEE